MANFLNNWYCLISKQAHIAGMQHSSIRLLSSNRVTISTEISASLNFVENNNKNILSVICPRYVGNDHIAKKSTQNQSCNQNGNSRKVRIANILQIAITIVAVDCTKIMKLISKSLCANYSDLYEAFMEL